MQNAESHGRLYSIDALRGADMCPKPVGDVLFAFAYTVICWLFLWFLYRKNVFLKV